MAAETRKKVYFLKCQPLRDFSLIKILSVFFFFWLLSFHIKFYLFWFMLFLDSACWSYIGFGSWSRGWLHTPSSMLLVFVTVSCLDFFFWFFMEDLSLFAVLFIPGALRVRKSISCNRKRVICIRKAVSCENSLGPCTHIFLYIQHFFSHLRRIIIW